MFRIEYKNPHIWPILWYKAILETFFQLFLSVSSKSKTNLAFNKKTFFNIVIIKEIEFFVLGLYLIFTYREVSSSIKTKLQSSQNHYRVLWTIAKNDISADRSKIYPNV